MGEKSLSIVVPSTRTVARMEGPYILWKVSGYEFQILHVILYTQVIIQAAQLKILLTIKKGSSDWYLQQQIVRK